MIREKIRENGGMPFRKKMLVTFLIVIILPLLLELIAFFVIGTYISRATAPQSSTQDTFSLPGLRGFGQFSNAHYPEVAERLRENPEIVEDKGYLSSLSATLHVANSYMIIRKGDDLYYTDEAAAAEVVFYYLPSYGNMTGDGQTGIYFEGLKLLCKQVDFRFPDGSEGSFFILTKVMALFSKRLMMLLFLASAFVLIVTGLFLNRWLRKSIFVPITELNHAMRKIRDGNLEYSLVAKGDAEFRELYQNYEDMRLRLKESADEKLERERQNRELVSNISHDLKTPITSIKGYVEGLIDGVANTPEKREKYIRTIYNKANDMDKLINELTLYSNIDNDKVLYNFHKINVSEYFGDCVEEIGMDMESRGIILNYANMVSPDTLIIADSEQLKRVVNNIIGNSVKYIDKKQGKIDIRILDEQDSIRVEIEDNGKGIDARDIPNIFDRFYRTDSSRNSSQGGSGIGLSIVRKIIEDHGGYIWATSREGEGTCMHFVIRKYHEMEYDASVEI